MDILAFLTATGQHGTTTRQPPTGSTSATPSSAEDGFIISPSVIQPIPKVSNYFNTKAR